MVSATHPQTSRLNILISVKPFECGYFLHGGSSSDCTEAERSPDSLALPASVASSQGAFATDVLSMIDEFGVTREVPLIPRHDSSGMFYEFPKSDAHPDVKVKLLLPQDMHAMQPHHPY